MAPRFKKNMFYCSKKDSSVIGLIGFCDDVIFKFRDSLAQDICNSNKEFFIHKEEGNPTPVDSEFLFFEKRQRIAAENFFKKKRPGFLHVIFYTKTYRKWRDYYEALCKAAKVKLETSHDFPCLVIKTICYSPDELSTMIRSAAKGLSLEIYENKELEDVQILMSNGTFDASLTP
jgi:hypothetical protein